MTVAAAIPQAAIALRNAENSALNKGDSFYSGKGRDDDENSNPITNIQSKVKKKTVGAIVTIALALIGGGTLLGVSNSLLMGAFNTLTEFFTNTRDSSLTGRLGFLLSKSSIRNNMSDKFKTRLAASGVTVKSGGYEFKTKSGNTINVSDADFEVTFKNNTEFRSAIITAKYGRVASFFDKFGITFFRSKILQSRNKWSSYEQTGDAKVDDTNFKNTMTEGFEGNTIVKTQSSELTEKKVQDVDGNGTVVGEHTEIATETSTKRTSGATSDFATAKTKANAWLSDISAKAEKGTDILCGLMRIVNSIAALIALNEIKQSIEYFMGFAEPTSKTMAGLGTESPINATLNFLSESKSSKVDDYNTVKGNINLNDLESSSNEITIDERSLTGSPLESNGLQMLLGGAIGNRTEAKNYSLERVGNTVMSILKTGQATFTTCAVANIVKGTVSGLVTIGTAILTAGASLAISSVWKFLLSAAVTIAIPIILKFAIPAIAKAFFTNAFENAVGKEAGEFMARGAANLNFRNSNLGGQSHSSKSAALAYNHYNQEMLALEAEVDRLNHSPFDITNKNTFLGSIAYSFIPIFTSSKVTSISGFMRVTKNSIASIISPVHADGEDSNYVTTFGECETLDTIGAVGDIYCNPIPSTDLSTIDLDPDDPSYNALIDDNLDDEGKIKKGSNLYKFFLACSNSDGQPGVVNQSFLSEFEGTGNTVLDTIINITPGVGDIADAVDGAKDLVNIDWASGARCVNYYDGGTSRVDEGSEIASLSGARSVSNVEFADPESATFWEKEGKYYQRYIEDTRIKDQIGALEENNPIVSLMEDLEEKWQNETEAERIARQAGLTVNDVEGVIALVEMYMFIDQYDPSVRIAFDDIVIGTSGEEVVAHAEAERIFFKDKNIADDGSEPAVDNKSYIAYFNLRDRNYAV